MISISCTGNLVYAMENDTLLYDSDVVRIVTAEEAEMIEQKISEKNMIRHEISMLERNIELYAEDKNVKISALKEKEDELDKEIESLGAETPSEELLIKLLAESDDYANARSSWHPSEVIDKFSEAYDVRGYVTFGDDLEMQYHVLFSHNGNDPYLCKKIERTLEESFASEMEFEEKAKNLINIYFAKLIGGVIESKFKVLQFLPWELMLEKEPDLYRVLKNSDVLECIASVYTVIKFVYVYDTENDTWNFALSTNRIDYAYTLITPVYNNGKVEHISIKEDGMVANGEMGNSVDDASEAFSRDTTMNTCMDAFALEYGGDIIFSIDIYTPNTIASMLY